MSRIDAVSCCWPFSISPFCFRFFERFFSEFLALFFQNELPIVPSCYPQVEVIHNGKFNFILDS